MENGLKGIKDLFEGRHIFRIPEYQRSYSWERPQLQDLFDDLSSIAHDHNYFLGSILLFRASEEHGFTIIDVVDGQQRITTIMVLINSLLRTIKGLGAEQLNFEPELYEHTYLHTHGRVKLRLQEHDREFFESSVLQDDPNAPSKVRTPSQQRLLNARGFFDEEVEGLSVQNMISLVTNLERSNVLTYSVDHPVEAALIFETTNDRGRSLTNLEKVKSFFMYHQYLMSDGATQDVEGTQRQFAEMYRDADFIDENEDSVLQYTYIGIGDWRARRSDKQYQRYTEMIKTRVRELSQTEQLDELRDYISGFSGWLRDNFAALRTFEALEIEPLQDLYRLRRTANFVPLLLKCHAFDATESRKHLASVARLCEMFSFRVYGVGNKPINTARSFLYRQARDFEGQWDSLRDSIQARMLEVYSKPAEFERLLRQPRLYDEIAGRDLVYLFWKYENRLRETKQPFANPMAWEEVGVGEGRGKGTMEHIAPQNPREEPKVVADREVLVEQTEEFREQYLHSIGNLTFDPLSANASKSNRGFDEKLGKYFRRAPYKTQGELEDYLHEGRWDQVSIKRRAEKIVGFALDYWDPDAIVLVSD